ncbi:MAG: 50S ribosomal protein L4 [Candidatus Berkelbacteria bacterium]|nr:50S ribosomal protein L4 [Candidatus Berkelbacteria bacterium]
MIKTKVYNLKGESNKDQSLNPSIFEVVENPVLLSQVIVSQMSNKRNAISHTKTRGEVSGGGKKPFKQKGTGNARAGSTRSPLWIGGGITFGPRSNKSYIKRINSKVKTAAIKMVLSKKAQEKKFIVLDSFELKEISTKKVREIFESLPIEEGKILVVLPKLDANIELSMANIPYVKLSKTVNLNIFDLLKYDYLLTTKEGLEDIEKIFSGNVK